jgi:phosphatidylserine/phosphatidylglycerophosphate/cardiolipin synthase-like enzyme
VIELRTLTDGGQTPYAIAEELHTFCAAATRSLDIAIYDVRLDGTVADCVTDAIVGAAGRGVAVRLVYNLDHPGYAKGPPPPQTEPELVESLPVPTRAIPGVPDLMHHKYVVRDREAVWTGSTNWTEDSWSREENVIVRAASRGLAAAYTQDFDQLWQTRDVGRSGKVVPVAVQIDGKPVRAWFCPKRGPRLAHRIADAIGHAERLIRIASPVLTSGPILGTLAEVVQDGHVDVAGVVDATQIHEVLGQWARNAHGSWKTPALVRALTGAPFSGKRSTPYAPGSVHDYMHAKVTICDDTVFVGSFNLSHSGEANAENVLEIADVGIADRLAAYVDEIRGRYPPLSL